MKLVASLQAVCALQFSQDDAQSKTGVLLRDIFSFISERYKFSNKPEVPPGIVSDTNYVPSFVTGEIEVDRTKFAITQLNYIPGTLGVVARDTDIAEMIAKTVAAAIDEEFGLQIMKSIKAVYYSSDLVVEFEPGLEKQISALQKIKVVLEKEISRRSGGFDIKRLAFGMPDKDMITIVNPVEGIEKQDFLIERRAGEPHANNRYFSRAPVKTAHHVRILGQIEKAFQD